MWKSVPVIWQNCLYVDSVPCASDLAELHVPVILQQCLHVEEHASDLAELPVCGQCASGLAELPVLPMYYAEEYASDLAGIACANVWQNCLYVDSAVPVIWQNCLYAEECVMSQ